MIFGNRVPKSYFVTTGKGESGAGSKGLPFETGSYDAALNNAGIQNTNVIKYTSVVPTECVQIDKRVGLAKIQWGEVMESIMAQANGRKGEQITAAVMVTNVADPNGRHLGGFACEYSGSGTKQDVERALGESIEGMIERRGYGTFPNGMKMYKTNTTSKGFKIHPGYVLAFETMKIKLPHGTVLAALCFGEYDYPVVSDNQSMNGGKLMRKTRKKRKRRKNKRN